MARLHSKSKTRSVRKNKKSHTQKSKRKCRRTTRFGDIILNREHLKKSNHMIDLNSVYVDENIIIQFDDSDYLLDNTEYEFNTFPIIASEDVDIIFHQYLYNKHQQLTNSEQQNRTKQHRTEQ